MARTRWQWLTLVGLGTSLVAFTGCDDTKVRDNSREVGREVGNAAREVRDGTREAAKDMKTAAEEASQGFKEGIGGSGAASDAATPVPNHTEEDRERSVDDRDVPGEAPPR
ncbi:hypothetical protein [Myxococcus eversor]|uniref:hypothetical protein n=1 Tax=Myxococcus eversor TaxID=2709661 RepID=UPI0013D74303|nr:hypothetical protein [Myxococcus eversor]